MTTSEWRGCADVGIDAQAGLVCRASGDRTGGVRARWGSIEVVLLKEARDTVSTGISNYMIRQTNLTTP